MKYRPEEPKSVRCDRYAEAMETYERECESLRAYIQTYSLCDFSIEELLDRQKEFETLYHDFRSKFDCVSFEIENYAILRNATDRSWFTLDSDLTDLHEKYQEMRDRIQDGRQVLAKIIELVKNADEEG